MKKKLLTVLFLLFLVGTLFASPRFGYSVSAKGSTFTHDYGGVSFGLIFEPFSNGVARIEGSINIGNDSINGYGFSYFDIGLSTPIFRMLSPFDFLFVNKMIWAPTVKGIVGLNADYILEYSLYISPLHFEDLSFHYDFLAPFLVTNREFNDLGWGIEVLKISYLF